MSRAIPIDEMADAIMDELNKYAEVAADDLKEAVKDTARPHLAAAEQRGNEKLVKTLERKLGGGS